MGWVIDNGYNILKQDEEMSCGLCCCAMVLRLLRNSTLSERTMVNESKIISQKDKSSQNDITKKYTRPIKNVPGARKTAFAQATQHHMTYNDGTYAPHLVKILDSNNINAHYGRSSIKNAMDAVTKEKPLIIRVGESGHWVVVVKKQKKLFGKNKFTILDPGEDKVVEIRGYSNYTYNRNFTAHWITCDKFISQRIVKVVLDGINLKNARRGLKKAI